MRTERDFPQDWATTQNNLGIAYRDLATGDRGDNLKRAIECFQAAARSFATVGLKSGAMTPAEELIASAEKLA